MPYILDMDISNIANVIHLQRWCKSIRLHPSAFSASVGVIRETNECDFITDDEGDFLSVEISPNRELS